VGPWFGLCFEIVGRARHGVDHYNMHAV
jgi:hypothetical protein